MATPQTQTQTTDMKKNGGAPKDEFQEVIIDRPSFKPELFSKRDEKNPEREVYTGDPVQGYVIGHSFMGEIEDKTTGEMREVYAYVFKLTAPCKVQDRNKEIVQAKVGDEIFVWDIHQLKQTVSPAAANHPELCAHVRVTPEFRAPLPGGAQKMWFLKIHAAPAKPRREIASGSNHLAMLLATVPQPAALPEST